MGKTEKSCKEKSNNAIQGLRTELRKIKDHISDFDQKTVRAVSDIKDDVATKENILRDEVQKNFTRTEKSCKEKSDNAIQSLRTELSDMKSELEQKAEEDIESFETKMTTIQNELQRDLAQAISTQDFVQLENKILANTFNCPTSRSTLNSTVKNVFREVKGKCYFIQKRGCPDGDGCTFQEAQNLCKTVFGSGLHGHIWEPTTLEINNAVLTAAKDAMAGSYSYWLGVSNVDFKYMSNGKPSSISPMPWSSGAPGSSRSGAYCSGAISGPKLWFTIACSSSTMYTICEASL